MNVRERLLLLAILLLAALSRFIALDRIPYGVYPDEAIDGNEGYHAIATGQPRLFYPENNGREGLFINLTGISIALLGHTSLGLRAVSALAGTLAVLLVFALARRWFSARVGLIAAFLLATSFWHLNFSRIGFRGILVPTLLLAAVYGYDVGSRWSTALGGIALGLGFHSYIAFRAVPVLVAGIVTIQRKRWLLWIGVAALVASPMAVYFALHPEDFSRRIQQTSGFELANLTRTVKMFHVTGDCNPRHNLACQPQLNLPAGILLLIGLGCALFAIRRASHRTAAVTLLLWVPVMLLPSALSNEGVPHALRSIGAIPAVILLAAWGADWLLTKLHRPAAQWALLAILGLGGAWDLYRYFGVWAASPATREAFYAPVAELADYLNRLPPETPRYVIVDRVSVDMQPLILLTHGRTPPIFMRTQEFLTADFPPGSVVAPILGDTRVIDTLRARGIEFTEDRQGAAIAARIR